MGNIGPWEIVLLAFLVLLLFGAKRLPEIGRSLGTGMREFKDAITGSTRADPPEIEPGDSPEASARSESEPPSRLSSR